MSVTDIDGRFAAREPLTLKRYDQYARKDNFHPYYHEGAADYESVAFSRYGEAADVLHLEDVTVPNPGPHHIRVRVAACGLNPADWGLCLGLFADQLPRGIGLEVAGVVDAVGEAVTDVRVGERVLGVPDFVHYPSAGAADSAILSHWTPVPQGLDLLAASALPMAVETAFRSLESLGVTAGQTLLVHGAGTMMGFAAVQIALLRGARVIATAGDTFAERLRALGATVTPYGAGMVARVRDLSGGAPDLILDTAPVSGVLPALVSIAGGDARRVLTITDFAAAADLGVRTSFDGAPPARYADIAMRYDVLGQFAQLAAQGRFSVPVARTFALEEWRDALELSQSGGARGKLVLLPASSTAVD